SPSRRSRVTPGRSSTRAMRRPTSRLNSVDLPTLGRPTMAMTDMTGSERADYCGGGGTGKGSARGADEVEGAGGAAAPTGAEAPTPGAVSLAGAADAGGSGSPARMVAPT